MGRREVQGTATHSPAVQGFMYTVLAGWSVLDTPEPAGLGNGDESGALAPPPKFAAKKSARAAPFFVMSQEGGTPAPLIQSAAHSKIRAPASPHPPLKISLLFSHTNCPPSTQHPTSLTQSLVASTYPTREYFSSLQISACCQVLAHGLNWRALFPLARIRCSRPWGLRSKLLLPSPRRAWSLLAALRVTLHSKLASTSASHQAPPTTPAHLISTQLPLKSLTRLGTQQNTTTRTPSPKFYPQ